MATDCEVCLGVAAGGRIRLTDEGAELLMLLLRDKKTELFSARRTVVEAGGAPTAYNARLKLCNQILIEIDRTQIEMGWLDGQPQRTHA